MKRSFALVVSVAALLAAPAAANAGWTAVTSGTNGNTERVGLFRTVDGVLHVVYTQERSSLSNDVLHRTILPTGALTAPVAVASGWASVSNPAIVPSSSGLLVFFGGIHSTNSSDPNMNLNVGISTDGGATWNVPPGTVASGDYAYASDMTATVAGPALTPFVAWSATPGVLVHAGLSPLAPQGNFQTALGGCCGYDSNVATDSSGNVWVDWYSNATNKSGVFAQQVSSTGQPVGSPAQMPGVTQGGQATNQVGRVGIAARPQGGVYAAYHGGYPSAGNVVLWKIGNATASVLGRAKRSDANVNIAATSDGRIWIFWRDDNRVYARRSNTSVTAWGPVIAAGVPNKTADVFEVNGNAFGGALDLFATSTIGLTPKVITYWQRLLPVVTLSESAGRAVAGKKVRITFTVRDAGAPVGGAKVTFGSHSGKTNSKGHVTFKLSFSKSARLSAKATGTGYRTSTVSFRLTVHPK